MRDNGDKKSYYNHLETRFNHKLTNQFLDKASKDTQQHACFAPITYVVDSPGRNERTLVIDFWGDTCDKPATGSNTQQAGPGTPTTLFTRSLATKIFCTADLLKVVYLDAHSNKYSASTPVVLVVGSGPNGHSIYFPAPRLGGAPERFAKKLGRAHLGYITPIQLNELPNEASPIKEYGEIASHYDYSSRVKRLNRNLLSKLMRVTKK